MNLDSIAELKRAIAADDIAGVARLLETTPELLRVEDPADHCSPLRVLAEVRSVGMAEALLGRGLPPAAVSAWWAPGFGLNRMPAAVAEHLIEHGASITVHALAALGLVERLRRCLDQEPRLVHAQGGDGGRPLHFSRDLETARLLVERGAELDARDDDHDSTPAQWRIAEAPAVTRFLLQEGAAPDIFMAAALGDRELAERLVEQNPACTTYRIGNNRGPFPGVGFQGRGGTIYQWTLGFNQSPHEIARARGHTALFDFLMSRTPLRQQLLIACVLADRPKAEELVARQPGLVAGLDEEDRALLAKFCWETNRNLEAVRLMLDLGFPIAAPEFNHGFEALHNAAWCGDVALVELLLQRGHPVDHRDPRYHSTPLGFALHSCVVARRHPEGDFPGVVQRLLEAGAPLDEGQFPCGDSAVDAVIRTFQR